MALPENMDNWFQVRNSHNGLKVRVLNQYVVGAYDMNMCLTTPQFTNYALATGATGGTLVPMITDSTVLGFNDFIVIGNSGKHKNSNLSFITPMYFVCSDFDDDDLYIAQLLALPYFGDLGNTPTSTTDRVALTKQIYEAGMWIWRKGNLPPVNIECPINLELELDECYGEAAGANIVNLGTANADGNGRAYIISSAAGQNFSGSGGFDGYPYFGAWWQNRNSKSVLNNSLGSIPTANRINITEKSTVEWLANISGSIAGGAAVRPNYTVTKGTYSYTDGLFIANGSNAIDALGGLVEVPYSDLDIFTTHHAVVTGNRISKSGSCYAGDASDNWGFKASGSGNGIDAGTVDYVYGFNFDFGRFFAGYWGCFRVWDGEMTEGQAELCWLHNKWRVVYQTPE